MRLILILCLFCGSASALELAVTLAKDTPNAEAMPDQWPVKVREIKAGDPLLAKEIRMTPEEYKAHRAAHEAEKNLWNKAQEQVIHDEQTPLKARLKTILAKADKDLTDADARELTIILARLKALE